MMNWSEPYPNTMGPKRILYSKTISSTLTEREQKTAHDPER